MLSPNQATMSPPTARSSAPFSVESSHVNSLDSLDEKHQPVIVNCHQEEEHKDVPLELKKPRYSIVPTKRKSLRLQNNPTVISMKKWYQIRGWSLLYPLVVSLFLAIGQLEFNLRTFGHAFVVSSCVFCLLHLKNFSSKQNLGFALLKMLCISVVLGDFLYQFSIIGERGWAATDSYRSCYNFAGLIHHKNLHENLCSVFKAAYYLNSLVYLSSLSCFAMYLLGTSKLVKLVNRGGAGNGYVTQLDDEVDLDD